MIPESTSAELQTLAGQFKARAHALGFDLCGIASPAPSMFRSEFMHWLADGNHGEMGYMERQTERRLDPALVLPGVQSILVVGMNYYTESEADTAANDRAVFARFARNMDYHDVMTPRLRTLLTEITTMYPNTEGRVYVDTGPLLERELAQRAGLGWFGKNTMIINSKRGSWFLLGEILLNVPLPFDTAAEGGCGTCTRCLDACPTQAFTAPYVLDSRKCISYLTIEQRGPIPAEHAAQMGNRIFGCDICQEVCPFNLRWQSPTDEPAFAPRSATTAPLLADLAAISEEEFREQFRGSPVKRAKWKGLVRNAKAGLAER